MSSWPTSRATAPGTGESAQAETSALFELHRARVFAFCLGRLGDREEAADAVQDTYAKAWVALRGGCEVRQPLAWLLTIAANVCTSRHRARFARPVETPLSDDREAEVTYLPRVELAGLPTALRALPDGQRRAFVLRELRGCSYEEIGADLGVSDSSVAALIHRARRAVAASLGGAGRKALVAVPFPGVFRSAFEGGAAAVATTATCTILLAAPQLGSAPAPARTPPAPQAGPVLATITASPPELVRAAGSGKTALRSDRGAARGATRTAARSRGGLAVAAAASGGTDSATPAAPPEEPASAPTVAAETPSPASEPTLAPSPRSVESGTSFSPGTTTGASPSVAQAHSPASASRDAEVRSLPEQANGNGVPGGGAVGNDGLESHGPPADPFAKGNGQPTQANGDPGPPADHESQANGQLGNPAGQGNGHYGNAGGQSGGQAGKPGGRGGGTPAGAP